jgi:hypothetical protein
MGPELARLVDAGVLARAALDDGDREADGFPELVRRAMCRGELTRAQAVTLASLLGLWPRWPANDR